MRKILRKFKRIKREAETPDTSSQLNEEASEAISPRTISHEKKSEEPEPGILPDEIAAETSAEDDERFTTKQESGLEQGEKVGLKKEASIEDTIVGDAPMTMVADQSLVSHKHKMPLLMVGQSCHIGNVRERNEDSIFVLNTYSGGEEPYVPFGLYIIADGMGGHHAGHKASRSAAGIIARDVTEKILLPLIKNEIGGNASSQQPIGEVMLGAIQAANRQIYNPDPDKEGGTTATAALVIGRRLYIAHVGDSRAYLVTNHQLKQVTTDHSYVRRLIEAGQITEEEAAVHPQRNMLYRAVGAGGDLEVETFTQTLPEHGQIVLCSDGLWGLVPEALIEDEIRRNESLQGCADLLVDYALGVGGYDNISFIIVDFTF